MCIIHTSVLFSYCNNDRFIRKQLQESFLITEVILYSLRIISAKDDPPKDQTFVLPTNGGYGKAKFNPILKPKTFSPSEDKVMVWAMLILQMSEDPTEPLNPSPTVSMLFLCLNGPSESIGLTFKLN